MNRFESFTYIAPELDLVADQIHTNVELEQRSNYPYDENCPYQMGSGSVREVTRVYPDVDFDAMEITVQFVPK